MHKIRATCARFVFFFLKALPGQLTPDNCPSFKLVIVGDGGTGTGGLTSVISICADPRCLCWLRSSQDAFMCLMLLECICAGFHFSASYKKYNS